MTGSQRNDKALPHLTMVTGGARSGKSRFAETLVIGSGAPRLYLATAQAWDDEMQARIAAHRDQRGPGWRTVEVPDDPGAVLAGVAQDEVVLLDCATLWLTNRMLAGADVGAESAALIAALQACPGRVVVVTNELGWSIVPENALARAFRDAQGRLNQALAGAAGLVVAVISGLPLVLKGQLP